MSPSLLRVSLTCPSLLERLLLRSTVDDMVSTEASTYVAAVKWGEEGYYLKEFSQKFKLPQVAKIIKGQYQNLGVPSLPSPALNQIVFIASAGPRLKVVAQCVKFKDAGRRMVPVGSKLSVPENYDGWFEILSEDGRSVKCMESVAELVKRRSHTFLVREAVKVHLCKPEDINSVWDKTRTISSGEVLEVGELVSSSGFRNSGSRTGKFLRCITSLRETVYFPLELRGKFSNIAGEENISGVHTMRNLLSKRFPIMVRLVHGKPPIGIKPGSQFTPEMRLYSLIEEESLVAMPLMRNVDAISLPSNAPLKILAPRNVDTLGKLQEHEILASRCRNLMPGVTDCIQVCDTSVSREIKHIPSSPQYVYARRQGAGVYRSSVPLVRRSASDPQGTNGSIRLHLDRGHSTPAEQPTTTKSEISDPDDYRYEEIDQIYDYVRGFAPLPANLKNDFSLYESEAKTHQSLPQITQLTDNAINNNNKSEKKPPEPPPIETIPVRKLSNKTVRITQPHKITVSIINKSSRTKDVILPSQRIRKYSEEHVYERIDKRKNGLKASRGFDAVLHGPTRSNSASRVFLQNNIHANNVNNNAKLLSKNHNQRQGNQPQANQTQVTKHHFQKHIKNSTSSKDIPNINKHITKFNKSSGGNVALRNVATSPLFHIRYKSLTDLLMDSQKSSPNSSNSNGKKMEGSASTCSTTSSTDELTGVQDEALDEDEDAEGSGPNIPDHGKRKLSRPKSLSNLINNVAPRRRMDNHNYYNLVQNDLIRIPDFSNPKFYSMPDSNRYVKNHYGIAAHNKKLGTLYL